MMLLNPSQLAILNEALFEFGMVIAGICPIITYDQRLKYEAAMEVISGYCSSSTGSGEIQREA